MHSAQRSVEESINNSNRWIVRGDEELALFFKNPDNGEKVKLSILHSFFITGFFVFIGFIKLIILDGVLWPSKKNSPTTKAIAYPTPVATIVLKVANNILGKIS